MPTVDLTEQSLANQQNGTDGAGRTLTEIGQALSLLSTPKVAMPVRDEVLRYLSQCPELVKHLPAVSAETRKEFGPQAELSLEVYEDPEIKDRYLTLYVRLPSYDSQVIERIERISEQFAHVAPASGYFLLTTDFRSPRGTNAV